MSILGSYATLLLLGKRTSSRGWRNHTLLVAAAICFSAVAVWGMHFVSMISVRLVASPNVTWYIEVRPPRGAEKALIVPVLKRHDHPIAVCATHRYDLCLLVHRIRDGNSALAYRHFWYLCGAHQ